jgi:hypothetical protein
MNLWSGPAAIVHEVVEHFGDVIDCRGWIGVGQDIAERVEGRIPLEGVLVQIWYSLCPPRRRRMWDGTVRYGTVRCGSYIAFGVFVFGGGCVFQYIEIEERDN